MSNFVMGKDFSKLSQEEKNAIMADMRARRRGGNGRTGYRMPDAQRFKVDNFEDPAKQRRPGELAKFSNEHVKCVFVCPRELISEKRAYAQTKIYYIGFVSDSNRVSFCEFRESPSRMVTDKTNGGIRYRLQKYCLLFEKKNIDKDTDLIVCMDSMKGSDFMFCILKFMRSFAGCSLKQTSKLEIFKKFVEEYGIFPRVRGTLKAAPKFSKLRLNKSLSTVYDFVFENGLCPWINEMAKQNLIELPPYKKFSRVLVELGLFFAVMLKFEKVRRKSQSLK